MALIASFYDWVCSVGALLLLMACLALLWHLNERNRYKDWWKR